MSTRQQAFDRDADQLIQSMKALPRKPAKRAPSKPAAKSPVRAERTIARDRKPDP